MNLQTVTHSDYFSTDSEKENFNQMELNKSKLEEKKQDTDRVPIPKTKLTKQRTIHDNEKRLRCLNLIEQSGSDFPHSYQNNSNKEKLILEHVAKYKKIFQNVYGRRELLLAPKNEFGVPKFICSTIRPTKLGYVRLFDYKTCAEFLSNFLQYESLSDRKAFPETVPSPYNVLKWQKGDSLDIAIVLASLLLGAGFPAYVVSGTAEKFITEKRVKIFIKIDLV